MKPYCPTLATFEPSSEARRAQCTRERELMLEQIEGLKHRVEELLALLRRFDGPRHG